MNSFTEYCGKVSIVQYAIKAAANVGICHGMHAAAGYNATQNVNNLACTIVSQDLLQKRINSLSISMTSMTLKIGNHST